MGQAAGQYAPQMAAAIGESVNTAVGWYQNDKAADDLTARQNEANALYREQFGMAQADYKPYMEAGTSALDALMRTYGLADGQNGQADFSGFESSPDYLWAQQQGQQSLDRSAASRGGLYSGRQMKASQRFGQGLATQHLGNYRQGLGNISNQGLNSTNALNNYRMGYSNQLGTGITNLGDIAAAERMGIYAVNSRHNSQMQSIHGVGGGGGSGGGGGQSSFAGGQSGAGFDANGWGQSGYNYGSTSDNFNWGGG